MDATVHTGPVGLNFQVPAEVFHRVQAESTRLGVSIGEFLVTALQVEANRVEEDRQLGWQFNEAVSLLREARRQVWTNLGGEIDEALPAIQAALETLARRHA